MLKEELSKITRQIQRKYLNTSEIISLFQELVLEIDPMIGNALYNPKFIENVFSRIRIVIEACNRHLKVSHGENKIF